MLERYGYSAYGSVTVYDPQWQERPAGSACGNTVLYGGYQWDAETALYCVRNRYYHPSLGRWIGRDPIGYGGGSNLYGYVGGRPVGAVDADGLEETSTSAPSAGSVFVFRVSGSVNGTRIVWADPAGMADIPFVQMLEMQQKHATLLNLLQEGEVLTLRAMPRAYEIYAPRGTAKLVVADKWEKLLAELTVGSGGRETARAVVGGQDWIRMGATAEVPLADASYVFGHVHPSGQLRLSPDDIFCLNRYQPHQMATKLIAPDGTAVTVRIPRLAASSGVGAWANFGLFATTILTDLGLQYYEHEQYVKNSWLPREIAAVTYLRRRGEAEFNAWLDWRRDEESRKPERAKADLRFYTKLLEQAQSQLVQLQMPPERRRSASELHEVLQKYDRLQADIAHYQRRLEDARRGR